MQSAEAENKGYGRTLFERLTALYGDDITSMLTVQYRMHELIMQWSSRELYNDKVRPRTIYMISVYAVPVFVPEGPLIYEGVWEVEGYILDLYFITWHAYKFIEY